MAAVTVAIAFASDARPAIDTPATWWMLTVAFIVTEARPVHLLSRRGAHTLYPIEVPLVVALGVLSGPQVILARTVASVFFVGVVRRQPPLKVAFNTANAGMGAAAAVFVSSFATEGLASPGTWIWLLTGAAAGGMLVSSAVATVLSVFDTDRTVGDVVRELWIAAPQVTAAALVGLIVLLPITLSLWTVVLTSVLALGFHSMFLVYGRLMRRHKELESLYRFSTMLREGIDTHSLAAQVVVGVADGLTARRVELSVRDHDGWIRCTWGDGDVSTVSVAEPAKPPDDETRGTDRLTLALRSESDDTVVGWIVASDRAVVGFNENDRRLFEAMAIHAGTAFTRLLVEQRLREEVAHREELVRSKDQLIAAVSHELRTPLTGILGFAEILSAPAPELDPAERAGLAGDIAGEALDLSFIVEDLLTAARFDLGQLTMKLAVAELEPLVRGAVDPIAHRLACEIEFDLTPGSVCVDPPRARQILRNLVVNASRYGGGRVLVRTRADSEIATIEVWDDGDGVGETDAQRIFEPYQTAHPATTQPGAVGLGLPISRALARMMGGDVGYTRADGWTVFRLSLPAPSAGARGPDPTGALGPILSHETPVTRPVTT